MSRLLRGFLGCTCGPWTGASKTSCCQRAGKPQPNRAALAEKDNKITRRADCQVWLVPDWAKERNLQLNLLRQLTKAGGSKWMSGSANSRNHRREAHTASRGILPSCVLRALRGAPGESSFLLTSTYHERPVLGLYSLLLVPAFDARTLFK